MSHFDIPTKGLVFTRHDNDDDHHGSLASTAIPAQLVRLDLAHNAAREILRSLRNSEQVRLRAGKKPAIHYGKKSVALNHKTTSFPSDLFALPENGRPLHFAGKLSHTFEMQKAQQVIAKSDQALAALENTLKSIQEQKASNETSFVRNKEEMRELNKKNKGGRPPSGMPTQASAFHKDRLLNGVTRSTPSSPFLSASFSPRLAPTSAGVLGSGIQNKDKIRLDAIRIPLVHLLAVRPMTIKAISSTLHASVADCERVLQKVAHDSASHTGKKELKEKAYRELDVWKFPYRSQADRQLAIDHAIHIFDKTRVEKTDNLWQLLLHVEERGKGKYLSRLNFDKPAPSQTILRPESQPGDDAHARGVEAPERGRLQASAKDVVDGRARSQEPLRRKKVSEKEFVSKQKVKAEAVQQRKESQRESLKPRSTGVGKGESKYKSAETIIDSDEEEEGLTHSTAKPKTPSMASERPSTASRPDARVQSPKRPSSPLPAKSLHRSKLSTSSLSNVITNDEQSISTADDSKLKIRPRHESSVSRVSPRPRTDSSPQKPSPLGSSPPTNSTDLDHSSSSKASSRSSATSSPPSSTEMSDRKPKNFSPIISEKRGGPGPASVKRKGETMEDQPSAKRHQVNGVQTQPASSTKLHRSHRPTPERHPSDSASSSASEKAEEQTVEVVDKSKRFHIYWRRYKDLHDKISSSNKDDDQEMHELWKMHKRLAELKEEIWEDWRKLGKPERIEV